jgi:hypothetical protein
MDFIEEEQPIGREYPKNTGQAIGTYYGPMMHVKVLDSSITGIMAPYCNRDGYKVSKG